MCEKDQDQICFFYNFSQDWQAEVYPNLENTEPTASKPDSGKIYRVFTDVQQVKEFLTHPRFVLVDSREEADILWIRQHFKDFRLA